MDSVTVTIYYVGYDAKSALEDSAPFDSIESASDHADNEGGNVYSATAIVLVDTVNLEVQN